LISQQPDVEGQNGQEQLGVEHNGSTSADRPRGRGADERQVERRVAQPGGDRNTGRSGNRCLRRHRIRKSNPDAGRRRDPVRRVLREGPGCLARAGRKSAFRLTGEPAVSRCHTMWSQCYHPPSGASVCDVGAGGRKLVRYLHSRNANHRHIDTP